jgi:hypothetical protein
LTGVRHAFRFSTANSLVEVGDFGQTPRAGETFRHRCDRPHRIRNLSSAPADATMVCILKAAAME